MLFTQSVKFQFPLPKFSKKWGLRAPLRFYSDGDETRVEFFLHTKEKITTFSGESWKFEKKKFSHVGK